MRNLKFCLHQADYKCRRDGLRKGEEIGNLKGTRYTTSATDCESNAIELADSEGVALV
jgi:hypothetical protein